ncbi:MAG: hypothetical protein JST50_14055 [Bacteroidetes bacterium]|jgi:hypothetical protein|nr:hypothetical protein [Bacteroidota bacterium]
MLVKEKNRWLKISLANLAIVAFLGTVLRSKILFSMPWVDFKNLLHAHSHFAFGGWITLCLFTLMIYEILPARLSSKGKYTILLSGIFLSGAGMLFSFPFQGYGLYSIAFSTLFILFTYAFSLVFIKDLRQTKPGRAVRVLSIAALIFADLSSVGPFTLAYMMATHHVNLLLYKDSIYTYLHFQYNGFFTLAVFAIFFNQFYNKLVRSVQKKVDRFSFLLSAAVLPTLFLSYLWHFPNGYIRGIAVSGCVLLAVVLYHFIRLIFSLKDKLRGLEPFPKAIGALAMVAFCIKTAVQIGIVIPSVGNEVFGDRPIIIGYLHLVMLGFVSLYLLAHLLHIRFFTQRESLSKKSIILFTVAVIVNEVVLMTQGLSAMVMLSSSIYSWLLWVAAILLFCSTAILFCSTIGSASLNETTLAQLTSEKVLETTN